MTAYPSAGLLSKLPPPLRVPASAPVFYQAHPGPAPPVAGELCDLFFQDLRNDLYPATFYHIVDSPQPFKFLIAHHPYQVIAHHRPVGYTGNINHQAPRRSFPIFTPSSTLKKGSGMFPVDSTHSEVGVGLRHGKGFINLHATQFFDLFTERRVDLSTADQQLPDLFKLCTRSGILQCFMQLQRYHRSKIYRLRRLFQLSRAGFPLRRLERSSDAVPRPALAPPSSSRRYTPSADRAVRDLPVKD